MRKRLALISIAPAAVFLLAGAYFGSTRDFGAFLISIPVLGALLLIAAAATLWAALKRRERAEAIVAAGLIVLTPLVYLGAYDIAQRLRFLLWAPAHARELEAASHRDGIIAVWDSWGMAGSDTSSYLAADTQDRLGSKARAAQWTRQIGQTCGLWQAHRMWPKLYLVTTYTNCPYDHVPPAR